MKRLKAKFLIFLTAATVSVLVVVMVAFPVAAATSVTVTVNATPEYIDITSNASSYNFGVVAAGTQPNTGTDYVGITNTSSVIIDLSINSTGWSSGGTTWTYGAPGADTGRLMASSGEGNGASSGSGAYDIVVTNSGQNVLINALAASTNAQWEFELEAPSSYTDSDEQSTTVTLEAAADS